MKIVCNIERTEGVKAQCRVNIESERYDNDSLTGLYESIQIASILRAMRDHNKRAFRAAMEQFIEEELSNE